MDFFERLRQRAHNKFKGIWDDRARPPYSDGYMVGTNATIEALKKMMVGEPIEAKVVHETISSMEFTSIFEMDCRDYDEEEAIAVFEGLLGTDGEKVVAIVFRAVPKEEQCPN